MKAYLALTLLASVVGVLSEPIDPSNEGGGEIKPAEALEGSKLAPTIEDLSESSHDHRSSRHRRYGNRYRGYGGKGKGKGGGGGGGGYHGGRYSHYSGHGKGGHSGVYGGGGYGGGKGGGFGGGKGGGFGGGGYGGGKGGGFGGGGFGSSGHSFSSHHRKRSVESERGTALSRRFLETSIEDENDCDKKFVCEVGTKPMEAMEFTELAIFKVFGAHGTGIDVRDTSVEFQLANAVGQMVGFEQCETIYGRCNLPYEEILVSMKRRFEREGSDENQIDEP